MIRQGTVIVLVVQSQRSILSAVADQSVNMVIRKMAREAPQLLSIQKEHEGQLVRSLCEKGSRKGQLKATNPRIYINRNLKPVAPRNYSRRRT
jgi:hypothetical protein